MRAGGYIFLKFFFSFLLKAKTSKNVVYFHLPYCIQSSMGHNLSTPRRLLYRVAAESWVFWLENHSWVKVAVLVLSASESQSHSSRTKTDETQVKFDGKRQYILSQADDEWWLSSGFVHGKQERTCYIIT